MRKLLLLCMGLAGVLSHGQTTPPNVTYLYKDPVSNAAVGINPLGTIKFPATLVSTPATIQFLITNSDLSTVEFTNISAAGNVFTANRTAVSIPPNQTQTVTLTFTPNTTGALASALSLTINGVNTAVFFLSGTGVAVTSNFVLSYILAPDGNQLRLADGQTIPFSTIPVAQSRTATVSITNTGTGAGTVNAITVSGAAFKLSGLPLVPAQVPSGGSVQVSVIFTPTQGAAFQGSLQVVLGDGTHTFPLTGSGSSATFEFSLIKDSSPAPLAAGAAVPFPDTKVGSKAPVTIQVRNAGTLAGTIHTVTVSGTAYQITSPVPLPATLEPGTAITFTVTFSPQDPGAATAQLLVEGVNFILSGTGVGPRLELIFTVGSSVTTVVNGGTISFPNTTAGTSIAAMITVQNTGNAPTGVNSITVAGPDFGITIPGLPASLPPAAKLLIPISFSPTALGQLTGSLGVDDQAFTLKGFGAAPPVLPAYSFTGVGDTASAMSQPSVGLTLAAPYPMDITGTLTLTFASDSFANDPSIQFATGGQAAKFRIPANTTSAVFGSAGNIQFQTGSVVGVINITPSFSTGQVSITPTSPPAKGVAIQAGPPVLRNVQLGTVSTNSFELLISGYSTPRSVSQITLQFNGSSGGNLQTNSLTVNADSAFSSWFQSTASAAAGSQFTASLTVFVNGSIGAVQTVSAAAANSKGASNSLSVSLR